MKNKREKLSLLSEMIALVRSDHRVMPREYNFIQAVACDMEIDLEELEGLFHQPRLPFVAPATESERIVQFQRYLLLIGVEGNDREGELMALRSFTLRLGLNPIAVEEVLRMRDRYPDRIVPPEVLVSTFRVYYN